MNLLVKYILLATVLKCVLGVEYGKYLKSRFMLDRNTIFLNHGGHGAVPKRVLIKKNNLQKKLEQSPDLWYAETEYELYQNAVEAAADFVGSKQKNLFIVDNASSGLGTAIDSIDFKSGDKILLNEQTYVGVVAKAAKLRKTKGVETITRITNFPITSENDIVEMYKEVLKNKTNIKLAVIDHISVLGLISPVKALTELLHEHGILVLVDGAHVPGQLPLNVEEIGADFYVGNFYKWAYASHSCAFLWVSTQHLPSISTLVTSKHYLNGGSLHRQFAYLGARDTTNFFTLPQALTFLKNNGGIRKITNYTRSLLLEAKADLNSSLNTLSFPIPESLRAPNMLFLLVPIPFQGSGEELNLWFLKTYKIQVNFIINPLNGQLWVRIMANIYNEKEDYVKLKMALLDFMDKENEKRLLLQSRQEQ